MIKAIFLDRDETLNPAHYNKKTEEFEAPQKPEDFELYPYTIECLKKMQSMGFYLFVITNQPDVAKGKTTMKNLWDVHDKFHEILITNGVYFKDYYYCFHHPSVSECECRKPSPFFINKAKKDFNLNLKKSWMIGDRNTDIICGINAGTKTIKITKEKESNLADFVAKNLEEAVEIIKFCENIKKKEKHEKNN